MGSIRWHAGFFGRRFGWTILLVAAFLLAEILAVICRDALNGSLLGAVEAAAILFPVWLLGCVLSGAKATGFLRSTQHG